MSDSGRPTLEHEDVEALVALLRGHKIVALTGAGCSTESGIPDYRGPASQGRLRAPIQGWDFTHNASVRARYWARSMIGWTKISQCLPNAAHHALAQLEREGIVAGVITQNVDGLHSAAGSSRVIELHGRIARVRCMQCGEHESRAVLQERLEMLNPTFVSRTAMQAPDGDADVPEAWVASFRVPACLGCGGALRPDVVFHGENVARETVDQSWETLGRGTVLLVVGTSLTVYSGLRFVKGAHARGMRIGIVNMGATRGDELASVCVGRSAGPTLTTCALRLIDSL